MTPRNKIIVTATLLVLLAMLGFADYRYSGDRYIASVTEPNGVTTESSGSSEAAVMVVKQTGADMAEVIRGMGLTAEKSSDLSFIAQVATKDANISSIAVLKDGDRAGSVTWIESPNVKTSFIALKEALLGAFSPLVTDLHDETIEGDGPTRNMLTFMDPSLATEGLAFVRVRQRLYEFHIAAGKEDVMTQLMEGVTK